MVLNFKSENFYHFRVKQNTAEQSEDVRPNKTSIEKNKDLQDGEEKRRKQKSETQQSPIVSIFSVRRERKGNLQVLSNVWFGW